jgi:hypothetical protein
VLILAPASFVDAQDGMDVDAITCAVELGDVPIFLAVAEHLDMRRQLVRVLGQVPMPDRLELFKVCLERFAERVEQTQIEQFFGNQVRSGVISSGPLLAPYVRVEFARNFLFHLIRGSYGEMRIAESVTAVIEAFDGIEDLSAYALELAKRLGADRVVEAVGALQSRRALQALAAGVRSSRLARADRGGA